MPQNVFDEIGLHAGDDVMNWSDFKALGTQLATKRIQFLCRGHSNDTWRLTTSFHRRASEIGLTLSDYFEKIIPEVQYQVAGALNIEYDLTNQQQRMAFLAFCQHHGFPTPLLDWTRSPYIACYFAFKEVKNSSHEAEYTKIFLFDDRSWGELVREAANRPEGEQWFISVSRPSPSLNHRIVSQQGLFTLSNAPDMEEFMHAQEGRYLRTFLRTIRIAVKERNTILRDLDAMGINERTLFPDIDGLFRSLVNRFFAGEVGETLPEFMRRFVSPPKEPRPSGGLLLSEALDPNHPLFSMPYGPRSGTLPEGSRRSENEKG